MKSETLEKILEALTEGSHQDKRTILSLRLEIEQGDATIDTLDMKMEAKDNDLKTARSDMESLQQEMALIQRDYDDVKVEAVGVEMSNKSAKTYYRQQRIGRNSPCPCGSGRKYKKCCGGDK